MQRELMGVSVMRCLYRLIPLYMLICPLIGASPSPPRGCLLRGGPILRRPHPNKKIFHPNIQTPKYKSVLKIIIILKLLNLM